MPRLLHYSDIENVYDDPVRVGRLAGAIRSRSGADAVVCGTGDNTSPGVLALIERGRQALELFRAIDADVETFGNHDLSPSGCGNKLFVRRGARLSYAGQRARRTARTGD